MQQYLKLKKTLITMKNTDIMTQEISMCMINKGCPMIRSLIIWIDQKNLPNKESPDGILALYHDQGLIPMKLIPLFEIEPKDKNISWGWSDKPRKTTKYQNINWIKSGTSLTIAM